MGGCVYEVYFDICYVMTMPLATILFEVCVVNTI
jgi:hypothetical protein